MLNITFKTLLIITTLTLPFSLQATETEKLQTSQVTNSPAYTLLATMKMKENYEEMIKKIIKMQIQSNPKLESLKSLLEDFFTKYMSWEVHRDAIAALYAKKYTTKELTELNAFYQTDLGQKTIQLMPELTADSIKIGQSNMMKYIPKMKEMLKEELKKLDTKK